MTDSKKKMDKGSKKTKKKGKTTDPKTVKRIFGVAFLAFGLFLMVALVSFIGSEKNWLGPIFGTLLPQAVVYVFGKFSATVLAVCAICWGVWLLLAGEFPKLLRTCIGFSALSVLCPAMLALASTLSGALSLKTEALYGAGGRFGYFLVQSLIWPIFGKGNFAFPFAVLCVILLAIFVISFGLRPSHFAFIKIPFDSIAGWWANRPRRESLPIEKEETPVDKSLAKAKEKALKAKIPAPEWDSDYTIYSGKAKPFRGIPGAFDGTIPVKQSDTVIRQFSPSNELTEMNASMQNAPLENASPANENTLGGYANAAEKEIEEKERYLRENEWNMGAMEIRNLRDEIARLRQVQQMNDWENNRHGRPSIKGIVERQDGTASPVAMEEPLAKAQKEAPVEKSPAEDLSFADEEAPTLSPTEAELAAAPVQNYDAYEIPKVPDILDAPPEQKPDYTAAELDEISHQLEEQLENFKVKGKVLGISTGPMITRFEVEPGPGVKVSRFAALHEDLALALKAKSIRILAPIPGKSLVGVEVPNRKLQTVYCRDIFESPLFKPQPDKLIIALGKDITGNPYTMDLCRAPHILIAGQTGSGKSVCINTLMASLLFSKTPDELRMILVDPKVVELKLYEDIPHLLAPVVTQPDQAVSALKWACVEMDRRYEELAKWKVRNLVGYNAKRKEQLELIERAEKARAEYEAEKIAAEAAIEKQKAEREAKIAAGEDPGNDPTIQIPTPPADMLIMPSERMENMPYIVIVIDELADLMMVAGKEVEKYIARIAQKARAVGIHLVIATQRPSVNVITGLIKANLPARISFKVASQVDSRTVMDRAGAEKLLGRGDMLYRSGEDPEPSRVHGGFLTDEEVEKLADACSQQNVHYERLETFEIDDPSEMGDDDDGAPGLAGKIDPLALAVARYGIERGSLSTSEVQRHFSVGFSRAGKIVDQLERLNICGPKRGSKPRVMLVTDEVSLNERWPE
ncbi:MAG: DNA translocase FtsK [Fibrobacter sp.]|nr:DNA translocase FtsK [Fibrobacter sp.]